METKSQNNYFYKVLKFNYSPMDIVRFGSNNVKHYKNFYFFLKI